MSGSDPKRLIVTGDRCWDRVVYATALGNKPPNFLEAWEEARKYWNVRLPGGAGCLIEYTNACDALPFTAEDPFEDHDIELAESIYILTRQTTREEREEIDRNEELTKKQKLVKEKWRLSRYVITGEKTVPHYKVCELNQNKWPPKEVPVLLVDYNQGFRSDNFKDHRSAFKSLFRDRRYLIRTNDPCAEEWRELRKTVLAGGPDRIWYSPLQDLDKGALKFAGNWEDVCDRVETYLQNDDTLWDRKNREWKHTIVVLIWYDGALIFRPGPSNGSPALKIFAGDQPESFLMKGYGTVLGGGLVFASFLAQALFQPEKLETYVEQALRGLRAQWDSGYHGPKPDEKGEWPARWTKDNRRSNLITAWDFPYDIVDCNLKPPEGTFENAIKLVTASEMEFRRLTAFSLGNLVTCDPDEARTLLRLRSRIKSHVEGNTKEVLSFAILGKPGAGKSFIARQLAAGVDPSGKKLEEVERNLSQFDTVERLADAFQEIQAVTLKGKMPFVLWDEFDTSFNGQQGGWWQYFLMPMQDGQFMDGKRREDLGKCVFAFIGGVFENEELFRQRAVESQDGKLAKGPDFHSRLSSILQAESVDMTTDVQNDPEASAPAKLVRALIIRRFLKEINEDSPLGGIKKISEELLTYLIHVPLRHGVRSLRQILKASDFARSQVLSVHNLPPADVLCLHVNDLGPDKKPVQSFLSRTPFRCVTAQGKILDLDWNSA